MSGTGIFVFSEPDGFATVLAEAGRTELVVIGPGAFQARMTRLILAHIRLSSAEERLARIAFVAPPRGTRRFILLSAELGKRRAHRRS